MAEEQQDKDEQLLKIEDGKIVPDLSTVSENIESGDMLQAASNLGKVQKSLKESPEASVSFAPSVLRAEVEADIKKQETVVPTVKLSDLLNSNKPLSEFKNVPPNITKNDLSIIRYYTNAKKNKLKLLPEEEAGYGKVLGKVINEINASKQQAQFNVPQLPVPFTDPVTQKLLPEYDYNNLYVIPNSKKALAHNRTNMSNFMGVLQDEQGKPFTETNPLASKVLMKHFGTGSVRQEVAREFRDFGGGLNSVYKAAENLISDTRTSYSEWIQGNEENPMDWFRKNSVNRKREHQEWLNKPDSWLPGHTSRLNQFIEKKFIEENGQETFNNLSEDQKLDLKLTPDQALNFFNFAFSEQGMLEQMATFAIINAGTTAGLIGTSKILKFPFIYKGYAETPRNFYLRMDNEKRRLGYLNMPTSGKGGYIQMKFGKEYETATGFKKMGALFNTIRTDIKGEVGYFSTINQEKNIGPTVKAALDKAHQNLKKAYETGNKSLIERADKQAILAEDNYLLSLMKNNKFDPNNNFIIPKQYISKIAGAETFPSAIQGFTYSAFDDPSDPSSLQRAELYSALGYLTAATGVAGIFTNAMGNVANRFEVFNDISFTTKSMIDNFVLMDRFGISFPKLLDEDVANLKISDVPGGPKRDITPTEYKGLMQLKNVFSRLGPESMGQAEKNRKILTSQIGSIDKIMPDGPTKDFVLENLKLSFAETSQIQALGAIGQKMAMNLNFRDIVKVTPRFLNSIKHSQRANNRLLAHSLILKELEEQFVMQSGKMSKAERKGFTDVIDIIRKTNKALSTQLNEKKTIDRATLKALKQAFSDPDKMKGKSAAQMAKIASDLFEASKELDAFIGKPTLNYDELLKAQEKRLLSLSKLTTDLVENIQTSIANYSQRGGNVNALRDTGSITFSVTNKYRTTTGDELYSSLDRFDDIDSQDIITSIFDLHKGTSFSDGISEDKLLTAFIPNSAFANSNEGSELVSLINLNSEKALKATFEKTIDKNLPAAERASQARSALDDFKAAMDDIVRDAYGIQDYEEIGNVHFLDYLKNNSYEGKQFNVEPVTISIKEADMLYRNISEKGRELLQSDSSIQRATGAAYIRLSNKINNQLKNSAGGKELQFVRIEHFANVGNKQKEGSFFGEYYNYEFSKKKQPKKDLIIREAAGMNLLESLKTTKTAKQKLENLASWRQSVQNEFGIIQFPPEYADPNNISRINRELNLDEVLSNGKTIREDIRDKIKNGEIPYVLDDTTDLGKQGIALMDSVMKQLFKEMNVYEIGYKNVLGRVDSTIVPKPRAKGPTTTMLTRDDGLGLLTYKEMQDALSFKLKSGKTHTVDLDAFIKTETDLRTLMESDDTLAKQYNDFAEEINLSIDAKMDEVAGKFDTDSRDLQNKFQRILNFKPEDGLLQQYLGALPPGIPDEAADINRLSLFERDFDLIKTAFKQDGVQADEEEISKYFAGVLLQELQENIGKAKPVPLEGVNGGVIQGSIMQDPYAALKALESPTTKAIFKKLGVTDDQYDALLAVTGHSVFVDYMKRGTAGGITLPETAISDTGIISRAFNYARGLVSKEYIIVEAGFRIMRDNDMRMMDFILNDPEAAEMFTEMLSLKNDPSRIKFLATTFPQRMKAYIARNLAFAGTEVETFQTYQPTEKEEGN